MKLRRFLPSDLDRVLEIEKVSFLNPYSISYFEKLHQNYPEGFIVAEDKKRVIGYIVGQVKNGSGEIISLAVESLWQRKGIGKNLTNFLITQFKEKGLKEIFLHVRVWNKVAIAFYENLGFEILKTIKNYYPNRDNAYLMKKEI